MYQIFNDRGWHYKCANVVLYHLYNKYAWLQTSNPTLSSEYPHWVTMSEGHLKSKRYGSRKYEPETDPVRSVR
jgi:hypothetical protein